MLTYEQCFDIVKKEIHGMFVTFSQQLENGEYCFLYFDHYIGPNRDDMPTNPYSITIDPATGETELHGRAFDYFRPKEHWAIDDSIKKIMAFV